MHLPRPEAMSSMRPGTRLRLQHGTANEPWLPLEYLVEPQGQRRTVALVETPFSRDKLDSMSFTRITVREDQIGGVPCIRGLRIPVATVVGMLADGMNDPEILAAYPDLEAEDIREAMRYAAEAVRERELPLLASA